MKKVVIAALIAATIVPAKAQIFSRALTTTPVVTQAVAREQEQQPQQVTHSLNSGGGSPMSSANALFGR